jgi:predicted dehydrogenase
MLAAARSAGTKHMCGFNYRFVPAVQLARDLIQRGVIGRIYEFRGTYLQGGLSDPNRVLTEKQAALIPGTSTLAAIGSHVIDQARFLVGEVGSVSALMGTFAKSRPTATGGFVEVPMVVRTAWPGRSMAPREAWRLTWNASTS